MPPVAPNNDNAIGFSPNDFFLTQKDYHAIGPVDLTFDVVNSGGMTEYSIREGVATAPACRGVHTISNSDTASTPHLLNRRLVTVSISISPITIRLSYSMDPPGFYFPTAAHTTEDDIVAGGGVMPSGGFATFRFSVDVPDGITQFTVRQSPIASPEPCSCGFALIGLAGLTLYHRQDNRLRLYIRGNSQPATVIPRWGMRLARVTIGCCDNGPLAHAFSMIDRRQSWKRRRPCSMGIW